jgi:hypothetical protein
MVIFPIIVDPFLTISAKDTGFIKVEIGVEKVGVEVVAFPTIFYIWVDI